MSGKSEDDRLCAFLLQAASHDEMKTVREDLRASRKETEKLRSENESYLNQLESYRKAVRKLMKRSHTELTEESESSSEESEESEASSESSSEDSEESDAPRVKRTRNSGKYFVYKSNDNSEDYIWSTMVRVFSEDRTLDRLEGSHIMEMGGMSHITQMPMIDESNLNGYFSNSKADTRKSKIVSNGGSKGERFCVNKVFNRDNTTGWMVERPDWIQYI